MRSDVIVLTALDDEYVAMRNILEQRSVPKGKWRAYDVYTLPCGTTVTLIPTLAMGQLNAAVWSLKEIQTFSPRLVLLVGIAACMYDESSAKAALGDVVVSQQIFDYELEKISNEQGVVERWQHYRTPDELSKHIEHWARNQSWNNKSQPARPDGSSAPIRVHIGDVLSGNKVVNHLVEKTRLRDGAPTAIALEMEAAGVAKAVQAASDVAPWFVMIKSFTDWADGSKNDVWRSYACHASALIATDFLIEAAAQCFMLMPHREENAELLHRRWNEALASHLASGEIRFKFVRPVAESILAEAVEEIKGLIPAKRGATLDYHADLAYANRYLQRAQPLFRHASRVYAVALDYVSTFFTDPHLTKRMREYLIANAGSAAREDVMRLFVFATPERMHLAAKSLDVHSLEFPNTFVCSKEAYEELLRRVVPDDVEHYTKRDFAVLEFEEVAGTETIFATLASEDLRFSHARFERRRGDVDIGKLTATFREVARVQRNQIHAQYGILRWEPNAWKDAEIWRDHLEAMFLKRTADVFHILSFNITEDEYQKLKKVLAKLKYDIFRRNGKPASLASEYGVKHVWLVRGIDQRDDPVREPQSRGKLYYPANYRNQYLMLMQLEDENKLRDFLTDERNLELRLNLWSTLGGLAADAIRHFKLQSPKAVRELGRAGKLSYEIVERLAADNMLRQDYQDDELISEIVLREPDSFE